MANNPLALKHKAIVGVSYLTEINQMRSIQCSLHFDSIRVTRQCMNWNFDGQNGGQWFNK